MLGWNRNSLNDVVNGDAKDLGVCVRESYSRSQLKLSNLPYYIDHEVLFCDRPVVFLRKDHPLLQQEWSMENFLNCPHSSVVLEVKETWGLDLLLEDEGLIRKVPVMVSSFERHAHRIPARQQSDRGRPLLLRRTCSEISSQSDHQTTAPV